MLYALVPNNVVVCDQAEWLTAPVFFFFTVVPLSVSLTLQVYLLNSEFFNFL